MKATIKDVAREAGVSIATVSRVLNNKDRVKDSTREKVEAAIEKLRFQPDQIARTMIMGETRTIGLIIPTLSNEYWAQVSEVIQEELWNAGYTLMLFTSNSHDKETAFLKTFIEKKVDGVIYAGSQVSNNRFNPYVTEFLRYGIPMVALDAKVPGINRVAGDHIDGAMEAVEHLVRAGHRDIAFMTGNFVGPDRETGYRNVHDFHHLTVNERLKVYAEHSFTSAYDAVEKLLASGEHFTAMFCVIDVFALAAIRALEDQGYRVPEDIAVVGYDDISMAGLFKPGLTTVRQPYQEIGSSVVGLLMEVIESQHRKSAPKTIILRNELIIRESCGGKSLQDLKR